MLKLDRNVHNIERLQIKTLTEAGIWERRDIQRMVENNPRIFFDEMGENLLLVGSEVKPSKHVDDRIDLLAIDDAGTAVVIELKRSDQKLQLLQSLSYASMVADWQPQQFVELRSKFSGETAQEACDAMLNYSSIRSIDDVNGSQRVILIAEAFDYAR